MESWQEKDNHLVKTFTFTAFMDAINWMKSASKEIDALNHHPSWTNVYNRVEVALTTHDAGNIVTEKDHELAKVLDRCYLDFG